MTDVIEAKQVMTAYEYLVGLPWVPMAMNGNLPIKASNSQKKRWLQNKSVLINGIKPGPDDLIELPVKQLVFFPGNEKSRCTMK